MTRRALNDKAKAERRLSIVRAASALLDGETFTSISMESLARKLELAKGTLYLYFETKECLFLAVIQDEIFSWLADVENKITACNAFAPDQSDTTSQSSTSKAHVLTEIVCDTMAAYPTLPRSMALLHGVLEHNLSRSTAIEFKKALAQRVSQTGSVLEEHFQLFSAGEGVTFLLHLNALAVGLWNVCNPSRMMIEVLSENGLEAMRLDFFPSLRAITENYLTGWEFTAVQKQF